MKTSGVHVLLSRRSLLVITALFFSSLSLPGQSVPKRPQSTFTYQDERVQHVVRITYLSKDRIAFAMSLRHKKTGKLCQLSGEARTAKGGGAEAPEDEDGNLYLATGFHYYQGEQFLEFLVEIPSNYRPAKRLQISHSHPKKAGSCDYNSEYYILTITK
jgi:hypothetical protein